MDEPHVSYKFDIFFFVAEFLFGGMDQQVELMFSMLPDEQLINSDVNKFVFPFIGLVCLYLTDSYVGKPLTTYVSCAMGVILQLTVIIAHAAHLPYDAQAVRLSTTLVSIVIRPVRWSVMYTIKPVKPFKVIRRFVILTEIAYYLGIVTMKALKLFVDPTENKHRWRIILPAVIAINLILYPLFLHLIYERLMKCPMHFKLFSVEKAVKDVNSVVLKKVCKKCHKYQQPSAARNQELAIGILVLLAVLIPYAVAMYDYELIKRFSKMNRVFLVKGPLSGASEILKIITTILSLLVIEFGVLRIGKITAKFHPYYITWMTCAFIVILTALLMMVYIYLMLETEIPFPKLPRGKAHMTVFNCLPASIEIEWAREGNIVRVRNQDYVRKLFISLREGKTETTEVTVYNKPIGMYRKVNITLEEGRENVFVATYNGLTRANMTEKLAFNRFKNEAAQLRVLDCLEVCCHGNISFTPTIPALKRTNSSIKLSTNLLSPKHELEEGEYKLAYHPDEKTTYEMGVIKVRRLDKTILLIHSLQNPGYRVWDTVTLSRKNTAIYIPMIVLLGMFRAARPFEKLAIIMKTAPEIYSVMFGLHTCFSQTAAFGAAAFYIREDLDQNDFFLVLGLSTFTFLLFLAAVLKLRNHFQGEDDPPVKQEPKSRGRSTSKSSTVASDPTGPSDPLGGTAKVKDQ